MGKRAFGRDRRGQGRPSGARAGDERARPPGRPIGADADRTRERILAAALETFAEHGFAGCSIRDIARQARIRSSSLYHYFPSKEALYEEVLHEMQGKMRDIVFAVLRGGTQDLRAFCRESTGRIFDFFLANPACVRFGLHSRFTGAPMFDRRTHDRWLGFMEGLLGPAEAAGTVKPFDPALLIASVDALVQMHVANDGYYRAVFGKGLDDAEIASRVREHVIQVVLRAVGLE